MDRRKFIGYTGLASASLLMPKFLSAGNFSFLTEQHQKTLVVIQLSGGNDGLNTVIPYRNELYYKYRPGISIDSDEMLRLNNEMALHPSMEGMKSLYDEGLVGILNNVGYPNPDRSHFRSMDIWQTASDSKEYLSSGWVGRYLDANCDGKSCNTHAIEVDDTLGLAMKGNTINGLAVKNVEEFHKTTDDKMIKIFGSSDMAPNDSNSQVSYLYKTLTDTLSSADYIYNQSKIYKSSFEYPKGDFAKDLKTVAELIISHINTRVFYVSLGGFDTHVNQQNRQQDLLKQLSDGLKVFMDDLKKNNCAEDVMVMTFSEFGRRVKQNASGGTDHGTANNIFLIGSSLKKKGVLNETPNLDDLDNGDLIHKVDFRQVYATFLDKWLQAPSETILNKKFDLLDFV